MAKDVCVITGGGSGMGFETAKILGKDYYIVLVGRNFEKLQKACDELSLTGIESEAFACDVGDAEGIRKLAVRAKECGSVRILIHAAGLSPHMGDAETIMKVNAMGTINIDEAFAGIMAEGSCIINVSSMSAYFVPQFILPRKIYRLAFTDRELFFRKMNAKVSRMPKNHSSDIAYCFSKDFVIWYSKYFALRVGGKGIRVLSVTPGNFETPMGKLESGQGEKYVQQCAIKRFGDPKEIAELMAFCAGPKCGYLTATDIICDGGCIAGKDYAKLKI